MSRSCKFIRGQIFPSFRLIKKKGRGEKKEGKRNVELDSQNSPNFGFKKISA